jgi:hypothetical protein
MPRPLSVRDRVGEVGIELAAAGPFEHRVPVAVVAPGGDLG